MPEYPLHNDVSHFELLFSTENKLREFWLNSATPIGYNSVTIEQILTSGFYELAHVTFYIISGSVSQCLFVDMPFWTIQTSVRGV
ncbi:hypothetical protein Ddc_09774 [Ditylenchus destructor]|nr:hypothetical protein Ddc_09774 [Ditylenchus destructor]